jgi:cell division protein FtsI/penicillin-binding protein 2
MSREALNSASGLRPMSAFVVVAGVVVCVAAWVLRLAAVEVPQPDRRQHLEVPPPEYSIADRTGRTIARFVPRFDLEVSPRSLWQAHTPERIAERLAGVLAQVPQGERTYDPDTLLELLLPDAENGRIRVDAWSLTLPQYKRIHAWIESGAGTGRGPLRGVSIERRADDSLALVWEPAVLLSAAERTSHGVTLAWHWGRRIGETLDLCITGEDVDLGLEPEKQRQERRRRVWRALIPTAYRRAIRGLAPELVLPLQAILDKEAVAPRQMRVAYDRDRVYPGGDHELFGSWGYVRETSTEPEPRAGLELLCDRVLATRACAFLERRPDRYDWIADRPVRGDRANSYVGFAPGSPPPVVQTTLDLALQRFLGQELDRALYVHQAAVAQGIVIDVASGNVLAVDSREAYTVQPFAPVFHQFTPGSTFKMVTMATALEAGVVTPETEFEVGNGEYRVIYPDGRPSSRRIHEAEGALTGKHKAREFFAESVNAALAQIGLLVPDERFHATLVALGYDRKPGTGLGSESFGSLPDLPWKYSQTHASIGFGHELTTSLWTHAAALATIVRGGEWLPLRLIDTVAQEERRVTVASEPGRRVFSPETCAQVRDMMRLGALTGTGKEVGAALRETATVALGLGPTEVGIDVGTKTGTAQKVGTELCLHVELAEQARHEAGPPGRERPSRRELLRLEKPHKHCYTSSICVFGRVPTSEREIMVLVVVDEPCGEQKYGGKVAGPTAARVMAEALGLTRAGQLPRHDVVAGFGASDLSAGLVAREVPR